MKEIYVALRKWFEKTFGPARDPYVIMTKLRQEVIELDQAVDTYARWNNHTNRVAVQKEMADIIILIINLSTNYGMCYDTFLDALRIKHSINMKRKWVQMSDGTWKHLPDDLKIIDK